MNTTEKEQNLQKMLDKYKIKKDKLFYIFNVSKNNFNSIIMKGELFLEEYFIDSKTNSLISVQKCGNIKLIKESKFRLNIILESLMEIDAKFYTCEAKINSKNKDYTESKTNNVHNLIHNMYISSIDYKDFFKRTKLEEEELFYVYDNVEKSFLLTSLRDDLSNTIIIKPEEYFIDSFTQRLIPISKCYSYDVMMKSSQEANTLFTELLEPNNLKYSIKKKNTVSIKDYKESCSTRFF